MHADHSDELPVADECDSVINDGCNGVMVWGMEWF